MIIIQQKKTEKISQKLYLYITRKSKWCLSRNKHCSFRCLSFGSRIQSHIDLSGTDEAVDMAMVYRQSLFSPMYGALNFKTPAFKANKNRYKMVGRKSWYRERYCQFLLLTSIENWQVSWDAMGVILSSQERILLTLDFFLERDEQEPVRIRLLLPRAPDFI